MKFPYRLYNIFNENDIEILDGDIYKYEQSDTKELFALKPLTIFRVNHNSFYFHRPNGTGNRKSTRIIKNTLIQIGPYKTEVREVIKCRILNELEMYDWIYYKEEDHD